MTDRIDIHHHCIPAAYREWLKSKNTGTALPAWSAEGSLAFMDQNGIDTAWLSPADAGIAAASSDEARSLTRNCNEELAQIKSRYPGKFKAFGTIPFPDIPGSIREVRYCFDTLKLDGVLLLSNVKGLYPSGTEHKPLFEELNKQKAWVFLHPAAAAADHAGNNEAFDPFFEYTLDVSTLFSRFVGEGLFEEFDDIRFIFAHGGAVAPFLINRIGKLAYIDGMKPKMGKVIGDLIRKRNRGVEFIRKNYFDLCGSSGNVQIAAMNAYLSTDNFFPGSNFPWADPERASVELRRGMAHCGTS